jgi:hypothetical protein
MYCFAVFMARSCGSTQDVLIEKPVEQMGDSLTHLQQCELLSD